VDIETKMDEEHSAQHECRDFERDARGKADDRFG